MGLPLRTSMLKRAIATLSLGLLTAVPVRAMTIPWPDFSDIMGTDDSGTETINSIIQYSAPTIDTITPSGVITAPAPTVPVHTVVPVEVLTGIDLDLLAPVVNANINLNANTNTNVNVPVRIPWPTGTPTPSPAAAGETRGDGSSAAEAVGPESPAGSAEAVGPESPAGLVSDEWLAAAATMTEPAQLSIFAQTLADADANVKGISVDGAVLRILYRQPAKLFAFIPTHYTLTVQYDLRDDQTSFSSPWWLKLSSDNVSTIREAVSAQLLQLKAVKSTNSLERMAQVMAVLESILAKTGASVGAVIVNVK